MMNFRVVKNKIVDILGDAAQGRYRVLGYQKQNKPSKEILNKDRSVQVYYSSGDFPKSGGRFRGGPKIHDLDYEINLAVSASAKGDLQVLEDDSSSADQKSRAISSIREAAEIADKKIDELIEIVFQILMDATKTDLDLEKGVVSSRWIGNIQKDMSVESGDLVVKTANLKYTCRVEEEISGAAGNEPETVVFDSELSLNEETVGVGTFVENDNT